MGPNQNYWKDEPCYPVPHMQYSELSISSNGKANSSKGDGVLHLMENSKSSADGFDTFVYDPKDPVPTLGGCIIASEAMMGAKDQSKIELREDVLVYTSEILQENLHVCGQVFVELVAATSAVDTGKNSK
jgi:putative CocE/NonD family hydrolase